MMQPADTVCVKVWTTILTYGHLTGPNTNVQSTDEEDAERKNARDALQESIWLSLEDTQDRGSFRMV